MAPKRKMDDTTFDSGGSDSDSSSDSGGDDVEDQEYYYESIARDATTGRSVYTSTMVNAKAPASPSKPTTVYPPRPVNGGTWLYDFMDNDWTFPDEGQPPSEDEPEPPSSSSSESEDNEPVNKCLPYKPLKKWKVKHRSNWLDEVLRGEGRGDYAAHPMCICDHPDCEHGVAELRCKDCDGCEGFSVKCIVCFYFHPSRCELTRRLKRWNWEKALYEDVSLKKLGLRFYLGRELHPDQCLPPSQARARQEICRRRQRLTVLRQYHILSLESKCSMGEFYKSLVRLTNNTGEPPASRYQEFINMTRIWRNLQMLKRAGRGHETNGIAETKPGGCALECPACPHPGKNIPENWKDVPAEKQFLYALFLALDANFRMQRKDVSSEKSDVDLGNGMAFFGEVVAYMDHLEKNWGQAQPKSTCVAHDAVNTPDKEVRGTASSGIGTVDCARHNMKRPRGVGDLQQGERYLNMDYMFFKSIEGSESQLFFVSYDIACQWHKNIWDRMQIYPNRIQEENEGRFFVFLVPKFHLPAHIESCNIKFSFLLTRYVGQTDGEAPERGWANINPLALSTREMGPHLRREVVDDHFNDWNWKKILAMVHVRQDPDYIPAMVETRRNTLSQEHTLPVPTVVKWKEDVVAWEEDATNPNPFERTTTMKNIASRVGGVVRGNTDSSEMLAQGIKLEDTQRQLKADQAATGNHPTIPQKRVMLERCSKTRRKILAWMDMQTTFMPEVAVLRAAAAERRAEEGGLRPVAGELVQDLPLLMPSALDARVACLPELQLFELRLREGQAHEALYEMRHQLLVRAHEYKYSDKQIRGGGGKGGMRSLARIAGIDEQIKRAKEMYHVARKALEVLGPRVGKMEWQTVLQVLYEEDVRQMPEGSYRRRKGDKKESARARKKRKTAQAKPISWIWLADGSAANVNRNVAMNEALRIEWARTRALGLRNTEEVDMLEEEMRRTPIYLRWRADWWESQKVHLGEMQRPDLLVDAVQREGHDAYATRQAGIFRTIAARFEKKWSTIPALVAVGRAQVAEAEAEAAEEAAMRGSDNEAEDGRDGSASEGDDEGAAEGEDGEGADDENEGDESGGGSEDDADDGDDAFT
ncbi:hypothetical protein DFH09DRAFT_1095930 [Mycena vulgaris]|nr:hypothetical protein DFH09DRAFT_1095930 [Mycena vulgaris]